MRDMRVVLCLCAWAVVGGVNGQVGSLCRPNERLLSCGGCQRTCLEPARECAGVCRTGCYCAEDMVRNETGHCVKLEDCPPLPATYKQDTTEPRPIDAKCPENEEYRFCEPCNRTCDNPNPICPAQCARGCFCVDDLVRDKDGRCVKLESCANKSINEIPLKRYTEKPIPYKLCNANQEYKDCESCEKTCSNPNPRCPAQCTRGCFCKEGLYKAPNGDCLELEKCPKVLKPNAEMPIPYKMVCNTNQEYKSCESCEKTCSNPNPRCPAQCTRGCFCKEGLYKAPNGDCLELEKCPKVLKPNAEMPIPYKMVCNTNQEFKDCQSCEKTCSNPNPRCPAQCTRGCFCKEGLYKAPNGECLELEKCPKAEVSVGSEDPTVEDCDVDEEFFACGACEPTCSQPQPACPGVCMRGCQCRPPLMRHRSGRCVPLGMCRTQKCLDPNEEHACRYGCEPWCDRRRCMRPRHCELGCHCRLGFLRDHITGRCVDEAQCSPAHQRLTGDIPMIESNETLETIEETKLN